jgi:hypothetical protein
MKSERSSSWKISREGKNKRNGGNILGSQMSHSPININVHPGVATTASVVEAAGPEHVSSLKIPGLKDVAVKEYSEWLVSNVSDDTLKAAFRQACDITLSDGFELEHIYKDQNPEFFVSKGTKPGIARSFVENIRDWVGNVKKALPVLDFVLTSVWGMGAVIWRFSFPLILYATWR